MWRDCPHWPKQREIRLLQGESKDALMPLKPGDLVKSSLVHDGMTAKSQNTGNLNQRKAGIYKLTVNFSLCIRVKFHEV